MPTVLVVDDSAVDRHLVGSLLGKRSSSPLEKRPGIEVVYASNGREALALIEQQTPDLVITDLQMPEVNGLELVDAVRREHPGLPVILMTAHGSDDIAMRALKKGAASYVPKKNLAQDLLDTVDNVLSVTGAQRRQQRLLDECWMQTESHFSIKNDPSLIPPLIGHLQENLSRMQLCDENGQIRVAVALREALINAIYHGNLQVDTLLRAQDEKAYQELVEERRLQEPYAGRRVHVVAKESRSEAVYIIRDEGRGFDLATLPDPANPENLERVKGRGLLLIQTFMDEVTHNRDGSEITMVCRCDR
jgi:CheY-like chemotaxis protein